MAGDIRHLASYEADWQERRAEDALATSNSKLAASAWESFKQHGFPTERRGNELWKYTDVRAINSEAFRTDLPSEPLDVDSIAEFVPLPSEWANTVYLDGKLLTTVGVAEPSRKQTENDGELGSNVGTIAKHDQSAFVALNTAFFSAAHDVTVDGAESHPIHIVWVSSGGGDEARANYPRISFRGLAGKSATLIETYLSLADEPLLEVPVVEINLEANAELTHYRFQISRSSTYHIATTRVKQAAGSTYTSTSFTTGAAIGRHDVHSHLSDGAECVLHGLYVTNGNEHQSNEISATHSEPNGTSHQFYKGILSGNSQAVFSGKIVVERDAQKTEAEQKDLNLLLSHGAEIDTKPSLEIYADDVQCSHGATAGHVDEDTLFYLHSRGINYQTAQAMLIRGFAQEILDEFELPELRDFASRKMDELMPQLQASSDTIGTA